MADPGRRFLAGPSIDRACAGLTTAYFKHIFERAGVAIWPI
jgi:hypothetical protein